MPWQPGNREDPHAPGAAGQGATTLSCSRSSAASGLTIPIHHGSGGPARRAAGVGCARVVAGPMAAARRQGVTRRRHPGRRFSAGLSTPNGSPPASKDRFRRSRAPCAAVLMLPRGRKKAFENPVLRHCDDLLCTSKAGMSPRPLSGRSPAHADFQPLPKTAPPARRFAGSSGPDQRPPNSPRRCPCFVLRPPAGFR